MNSPFVWARGWLLKFLRVPHDPEPPSGAPGSLRIFRAGRNYYRLRFWIWVAKQVVALAGFVFMLFVIRQASNAGLDAWRQKAEARGKRGEVATLNAIERYSWLLPAIECLGLAVAMLQLPFTYALIRLDYEQRWYLVTDRSLRIRAGVWNVREMTLSFANIQQTTLQQGPLQRLLGLADLVVSTAGGGSSAHGQPGHTQTPWHTGILQAVDNAEEIRDLIQDRLRRLKSAGIGDIDDPERFSPSAPDRISPITSVALTPVSLVAAQEMLAEVRALRQGALAALPANGTRMDGE